FPILVAIIVLIFIHQQHRRRILREGLENHNDRVVSNPKRSRGFSSFLSVFVCFKKHKVQTNLKERHSQENSFNDTIPENYLLPVLFPSQEDMSLFTRTFYSDSNDHEKMSYIRSAVAPIKFIISLSSSLLTLFFYIFILKPVSVVLKSDQDMQNSSKFQEKNIPFYFVLRSRDVDVTISPNSTPISNTTNSLSNSSISSTNGRSPDSVASNSTESANNAVGSGNSNSTVSDGKNTTDVSKDGASGSSSNGNADESLQSSLNGTKPSSSSDATASLGTIIITKTVTDTVTSTVTMPFAPSTTSSTDDSTQVTLSNSTETSYGTTFETSYESATRGTTVSRSISQVSTFSMSQESHTSFPADRSDSNSHKFDIFRTRTVLMITAPIILFIIILIIILWYWHRKSSRASKIPPRKQVEDYNIMPIITGETGGIQRTNYLERNQPYGSGIDDSNKWGYRGWGPTNVPPNNKSLLTRNNSIASNASYGHQKQDYYSRVNEDKDVPQVGVARQKSLNRLSGMINPVTRDDFQNTKSFRPKNLAAHISGPVNGSFHDTLPYSSNTQNVPTASSKSKLRQDYIPSSMQESSIEKPYSYSDIPKSLTNSQKRAYEDRRDSSQRHSIISQKHSERPQLYNFSKTS
ncbi:unnamed protein product, partial [Pneumocystis jirovecii]